jgi:hypothetical protein
MAHSDKQIASEPTISLILQLADPGDNFSDQTPLLRQHHESKQTRDWQTMTDGQSSAEAFIHEQRVRLQLQRKGVWCFILRNSRNSTDA